MPIRYCSATSKRTVQPCRARAMRGMNVCYHHGGASKRGTVHPNYRHGFYSKSADAQLRLSIAFHDYRRAVRRQQLDDIRAELAATIPVETRADHQRFMVAYSAAVAQLPAVKLTPALAGLE